MASVWWPGTHSGYLPPGSNPVPYRTVLPCPAMWALLLATTLWLPLPARTPGATRDLTEEQICATKWGLDHRAVTVAMKRTVASWYGIPWAQHSRYEFDHLVPRNLGGADSVDNLWPMCCIVKGAIVNQAHEKDVLEVRLGKLVCAGVVSLEDAQLQMRTSWVDGLTRWPRGSR